MFQNTEIKQNEAWIGLAHFLKKLRRQIFCTGIKVNIFVVPRCIA